MLSDREPIPLINQQPTPTDLTQEVWAGLSALPKMLPCKLLYDARGSQLFEAITRLPEYYPTRAEQEIVDATGPELQSLIDPSTAIIELGSGSGQKTRKLLQLFPHASIYIAIDISEEALRQALFGLSQEFPAQRMVGVAADYLTPVALPGELPGQPKLLVFFGSTLGNFEPDAAYQFLQRWAASLNAGDGLLVGVDLKKDPARLRAAYNDAAGITAAFNRNILTRINRECAADFDEAAFTHEAVYNSDAGRIEMHLVSQRPQTVEVAGRTVHFAAGERVYTEYSHKYTVEEFHTLARQSGWKPVRVWTDAEGLFSLHYLTPR